MAQPLIGEDLHGGDDGLPFLVTPAISAMANGGLAR